ncbi:hypothetical protein JCM1840_005285 [Sporobolomyces johnsonii]
MDLGEDQLCYSKIHGAWPCREFLTVSYAPGRLNLEIKLPMAFIVGSNQNKHSFVEDIAQILVDEPGSLRKAGALSTELDQDEAPVAGKYMFVPENSQTVFCESRGPEDKRSGVFAAPSVPSPPSHYLDAYGTYAPQYTRFHESLLARDGGSFFEEKPSFGDIAVHIVYEQITGEDDQYRPSAGILLNPNVVKHYEDYEWSLYFKDGSYYFITFNPAYSGYLAKRHGKSASTAMMRVLDPPDPRLCAWHFRQCVQMWVRGYPVQMVIPEDEFDEIY